MANEEHLKILRQGIRDWNRWRQEHPDVTPELSGAYLVNADLCVTQLDRANLIETDMRLARLVGVNLAEAYLIGTDLAGANLFGANLCGANLHKAFLWETNFSGANLSGTNFSKALVATTFIPYVDLRQVIGLGTVVHERPSSIGVDTLVLILRGSGGRFTAGQLIFFENAGVPATLLEYLPSMLEDNPVQFFSCFISYSTSDEGFAERLNQDLNRAGIKTWKWDRDAVRGRDLGENIDRAIRTHDKTILVCSVDSLTSPQVEREVQEALDKETQIKTANAERRKEALARGERPPTVDADVLVPIRLDDTIFNWDSHLKGEVTRRMLSDFTAAMPGSAKYNGELQKLIQALNPRSWPPGAGR
jgi:hypothetical protein